MPCGCDGVLPFHQGDVDESRYGQYEGRSECAFVLHAKNMVSAARLYDQVGGAVQLDHLDVKFKFGSDRECNHRWTMGSMPDRGFPSDTDCGFPSPSIGQRGA